MLHDWPGNVRGLENTIEYAVAMTEEDVIAEDLILQTKTPATSDPIKTLREARETFEKGYLIHLLALCEGNVTKAAKVAGRYWADFYNLVKKHALKIGNFKKKRRDV